MADYWSIFAYDIELFILTPSLGVIPTNIWTNFTSPETRVIVLSDTEDRTTVCSFIWTKHRNVRERQTDRYAINNTAFCIVSNADNEDVL